MSGIKPDFYGTFGESLLPSAVRSMATGADGQKRIRLNPVSVQSLPDLLENLLERSQAHKDPDPQAVWFHIAGLLATILVDVDTNAASQAEPNMKGEAFISCQEQSYITFFLAASSEPTTQTDRIPSTRRWAVFNFAISSGPNARDFSFQHPFDTDKLAENLNIVLDQEKHQMNEAVNEAKTYSIYRKTADSNDGRSHDMDGYMPFQVRFLYKYINNN